MQFKEKEGYYYEFELDMYFVPSTIIDDYGRRTWVANHTNKLLGEFISENIVKNGLSFSPDRIFIISEKEDDIKKVKEFCNFVTGNDALFNIAFKHIITKFNLDSFKVDLAELYEKFILKETLEGELIAQPNNGNKKLKV